MGFDRRPIEVAAAALLAAACQQGVAVSVAQTAADVTIAVTARPGTETCLDSVSVYPDAPADASPVWVSNKGMNAPGCVTKLRFGTKPTGWGQQVAATPLLRGQAYRIMVGGVGFTGGTRFTRE
jgi:hypothetical protein